MMRSEYPPRPKLPMPGKQMDSSKALAILELLKEPGNSSCADCGAAITIECAWAVLSFGILVCDDCKLVHIELENHLVLPDTGAQSDTSTKGILPTVSAHVWEDKDIAQIRSNGNSRSNNLLLANSPVWQYRPSGNDGIKLKEYWIKCKYSGKVNEIVENSTMAAKKSFIGIQFTRPMPKGNCACCAVLQNDKLYLTSDSRNEEVPVECVETVVVNSQRIGHINGVQLTYRVNGVNDGNTVSYTFLQHDSMETVMEWVSLVLYTKYNLLKRKYPTMIDKNIAKILNCGVVKESYMHLPNRELIYLSLSEARLACFKHHLNDKPMFQIAVSGVMNFSASQYIDAVACFLDIDQSHIHSNGDWVGAVEQVLKIDKIAAMPDDIPKPTFPFSLLKKAEKPPPPVERSDPPPPTTVNHSSTVPTTSVAPAPVAPAKTTNAPINGEKEPEKQSSSYECYPPIGPMGEMGKVFRGELPPEAIKPPPSKNDISRIGVFGEFVPQLTQVSIKDLTPPTSLTSFATSLNSNSSAIIHHAAQKDPTACYPPIGGPSQAVKLRYDINALANVQAQMRRDQELEELRNGAAAAAAAAAAAMVPGSMFRTAAYQKQLLDQTRLQSNLTGIGRFPETDAAAAAAAAAAFAPSALSQHSFNGGFEPARSYSSLPYQDQVAWSAMKLQALERKVPTPAVSNKGLNAYGSWAQRPPTDVLTHQAAASLGRMSSWGSASNAAGGLADQWPNLKSPTSPVDAFGLASARDTRTVMPPDFQALRNYGSSNGKLSRSDSTSSASSSVASREQQMIIDNLLCQWKSAEQKLLSLIHNGYVPASDMSPAGLDKDSAEHAYTCVSELFELLWKQRYDLALSFLRGFREVFAKSVHPEIRNLFIGVGELDTMKQIFLQQGKEKFLSGNSGGPVTWKQPTPPPAQTESAWPPSSSSLSVRESPTDFSPWGCFSPTSTETSLWGTTQTSAPSRTASLSSDPWATTSVFGTSSTNPSGRPAFNRAPSRPVARSSLGENSPPDGSKNSSKSTSPRVITPPTHDAGNTPLTGIESTLKNLFMNSAE